MTGPTITYQVNFKRRAGTRLIPPPTPTGEVVASAQRGNATARTTACLLATAHHVDHLIATGRLRDYSEAAAALGISHTRMAQVTSLLQLAPDIQEDILASRLDITEGRLRPICRLPLWEEQREALSKVHAAD